MRTYLYTLLIVAVLTVAANVAASLIVDPYRIIHPMLGKLDFEPNSRYSKVAFLLKNCAQVDTYIAGDSRSLILSSGDFPLMRDRKFYNIASAGDDIASTVKRLAFLVDRGCPVAAVIVGGSVQAIPRSSANGLARREYPSISGENRLAFYARYFLSSQSLIAYAGVLTSSAHRQLRYYEDGHADYLWSMNSDAGFAPDACAPVPETVADPAMLAEFSAYRELADLAARHRFKAIVWMAPRPKTSGLRLDADWHDFASRLRAIPGLRVVEPDLKSPLLADFRYWHDCVHFRGSVFQQLASAAVSELLTGP